MKPHEAFEWVSLAPADILCWLAAGSLVEMWYAESDLLLVLFGFIDLLLSMMGCWFGMRPNKEFSQVTNATKRYVYPIFVIIVMIAVAVIGLIEYDAF